MTMNSSWLLMLMFGMVRCSSFNDTNTLLKYLFDDTRYNKHVRPVQNQSVRTQVNVTQSMFRVDNFNIVVGDITTSGHIQAVWYDELLVWDASQYGGIEQVALPRGYYWKPELILAQGSTDEDNPSLDNIIVALATVSNTGLVTLSIAGKFSTACDVDMTFYPFDSHTCTYVIMSAFPTYGVQFHTPVPEINTDNLQQNGEWSVEKTASLIVMRYGRMHVIENSMTVKRRASFVVAHNAVPIFMLTALLPASFWVPPNSGERLAFTIAIFLAFVFLSSSIALEMPRNALKLSTVSTSLVAVNIISTVCVTWSAVIVRIAMKTTEQSPIPEILLKITHWNICCKCRHGGKHNRMSSKVCNEKDINDSEISPQALTEVRTEGSGGYANVTWLEVANSLDKLCFYVILLCILSMSIYALSLTQI